MSQTATKPRTSIQLYRARGWKRLIKPIALRVISKLWVTWLKLRLGNRVQFGRNMVTNNRLTIRGPGRVVFGDNINAWSHAEKTVLITYSPEAVITIGDDCRLSGAGLQAYRRIDIGPRCMVSSTIMIDTDFHNLDPMLRHDPDAPVACAPIVLEENVWVAGQTAILKGVTIGKNSIVAFRAVVTKDVPPNVVVGGNPARVVKTLDGAEG
jgi:acetyltransferase-like isoleucine patch superfamily enzyme